jgi:hypothetical protein
MSHFKNGCCSARHLCPRHRAIADRYRRKRKHFDYNTKRLDELERLAKHRYGGTLPECFAYVIQTVANGRRWKSDTLASPKWLNVSYAERQALGLMTIGAFDVPKKEREALRRERYRPRKRTLDRAYRQRRRRANGAKPRAQYEAESASRTKPWLAAGFRCRRTWERHGKPSEAVSQVRRAPILSYSGERRTCDTSRQRLAPKPRRHASTTVTRKRQGRPLSLRLTRGSATRSKDKRAVRGRGRLSAQALPQSPASLPAALASPWGPLPWPQTGRVTVSDSLLSRPGAA